MQRCCSGEVFDIVKEHRGRPMWLKQREQGENAGGEIREEVGDQVAEP